MNFQNSPTNVQEPLLDEAQTRFTLFPIAHKDIWEDYKTLMSAFWLAEDITLEQDVKDYADKLTDDERHYIDKILAFFASADCLVNLNLCATFVNEVTPPEAQCFFAAQAAQENVHAEVYSLFIDRLVSDDDKKKELFNALEGMPVIKKKGEWAMKWSDPTLPFAARLVAWSVVEGLLFASSFAAIAYFKHRGLLPGLGNANEFISRDESLHCKFAAETLYRNHIVNKLSEEEVHKIVNEAVEIEDEFVDEALPCKMIGMSAADMKVYVRFTANRLLQMLGVSPIYKDTYCPWSFVNLVACEGQVNFFEKRSADYAKASLVKLQGSVTVSDDF